jgi:O-antigen/teichoic acid export membrane protein
MQLVLAAGLIVAAVTDGAWYWWAGAVAAAALALVNLSGYLRTERERRRPPDP